MNNPFEGKAIKFDTSEQLDHLAELANGCGLEVKYITEQKKRYDIFRKNACMDFYSIYADADGLPEIHYSDFVASIEAVKSNHSEQHLDMVSENINYAEVVKSRYFNAVCNVDKNGMYSVSFGGNVTEKFEDKLSAWKFAYYMILQSDNQSVNTTEPEMFTHPPIDVISIAQQFNLNYTLGRALECLLKKDIEKAIWYLHRENKTN